MSAGCPSIQQLQGIYDPEDPCQDGGDVSQGCVDLTTGQALDCFTGEPIVTTNPLCTSGLAVCDAFGNAVGSPGSYNDPGQNNTTTSGQIVPPASGSGGGGWGTIWAGLGTFVGGFFKGTVGTGTTQAGGTAVRPVATQQAGFAQELTGPTGIILVVGAILIFAFVRGKHGS